MKKLLRKNIWLFVAVVSFFIFWSLYSVFYVSDFAAETDRFQESILKVERNLLANHDQFVAEVEETPLEEIWNKTNPSDAIEHYLVQDDSLMYWSNNSLDVGPIVEQNWPSGFYQLSNGFYFIKSTSLGPYTILSSLMVKSKYAYENRHLKNQLVNDLYLPSDVFVNIESDEGDPIYDSSGKVIFHLLHTGEKNISENQELFIFLLVPTIFTVKLI